MPMDFSGGREGMNYITGTQLDAVIKIRFR